ncbi:ABC-2 type transport system ATP-binding protein [Paenibacillus uliginis N3/975]|uniref:ABC-2 type transport system ATP-binding protein n=1 Tax=Paenibacillus uliginis N3/975 TaxID=1313296 RepID=A0A1X7HPN4_9BACL|nr:ABC transporter ATP-binding protein [Paenibacillus uliginis]SMF90416.1 ABC-2 type transport system ATP-binding protein [Paenibacillus uliginis N3/975]
MILEVNHVNGWYTKDKHIIEDVHFQVEAGKIYALLGTNGAGKTTLLHILTSIHSQYSGEIYVCGEKLTPDNIVRLKQQRYFIPDHPDLFDEMSPLAFMEFVHGLYGKTFDIQRFQQLCGAFAFETYVHQKISTLSLGNRQKTALINGLLLQCPLLIMDEPLVGLDVVAIETFYQELRAYVAQGNSALLSTHLFQVVDSVCDEAFILHQGKIKDHVVVNKQRSMKETFFRVIEHE